MIFPGWLEPVDIRITRWMAHNGPALLRVSLGVVFFWFGVLKFFPGLITGIWMCATILLLMLQMLGTLTPVVLFPDEVFLEAPYAPTLEGQYMIKNLVLISAAIVLGALVRGGAVKADPARAPAGGGPAT
ncbi:MAG: hypothetical protein ACR2GK_03900 [Gemmatimonadaceae bacterium]